MVIYFFLIILSLIGFIIFKDKKENDKYRKIYFIILCLIFTLVSAIRYNVGTDYLNTYGNALKWLSEGKNYNYEFLFLKLNFFIIKCHGTVWILMAICSIFTIPAFFKFIKENVDKKYWFLAVFLFIGTTVYYATMNVVRQYVAIAILLYAYNFFREKKYIRYIIFNCVALLFHTSAIINFLLIILVMINNKKDINNVLIIFYAISIIGIIIDFRYAIKIFSFAIPERYVAYLNSKFIREKNYTAIFKLIIPNIIIWLMFKNKNKLQENKNFNICYMAMWVYVILSNMFYGINIFIRLAWYFEYYMILIIPMIIKMFDDSNKVIQIGKNKKTEIPKVIKYINNKKIKISTLLTITVIAYFTMLNIYSIFINGGHSVVPYHTFLYYNIDIFN